MKNTKTVVLFMIGLLWLNCNTPGLTPESDANQPIQLGQVTVTAQDIQSPYSLNLPRSGKVRMMLGNPGAKPLSVKIGESNTKLAPQTWTELSFSLGKQTTLSWQGEDLYLGGVYLLPNKQTMPNIALVSIDTLRADRFTTSLMPAISKLFENGMHFKQAYSPTPWTLPAHASLLSGQYPAQHGVRKSDQKLPEAVTTLAEVLREKGYYNWAITEGNFVSARYGLSQGFHQYLENAPQMMSQEESKISKLQANVSLARKKLTNMEGAPQFLFFHTYEVHCPYVPRHGVSDPNGMGQTQWLLDNDGSELGPETYQHLKNLYDAEVTYTDQVLAPLLKDLIESENWIVVFTSDHGEEFGEHKGLLHGDSLYQEAMHVPLVITGPGVGRKVVSQQVSLVDVAPTILDLLNLPQQAGWQGQSLLGAVANKPVFAESYFWGVHIAVEDPRLLGVLHDDYKLIQTKNFNKIQAELFSLGRDPFEQQNIHQEQWETRDQLFLFLEAYLANKALSPEQTEALTPEQLEALRALGYVE